MAKAPRDAQPGDRIRVTYEATITRAQFGDIPDAVEVGVFADARWWVRENSPEVDRRIVSVEVIEAAEPAATPEGVTVNDRFGGTYRYPEAEGWTDHDDGAYVVIDSDGDAVAEFPAGTVLNIERGIL